AAESGVITQVNKKAEEIYDYTREELIGQPPSILAPELYKKQHREILERMLSSAKVEQLSFEEEGVKKDGSLFPVEMSFSLSKREDGFSVIAVVTDITERKEAEDKLRSTRDHLDNVIESSLDAVMITDGGGNITRVNKAFLEMVGCSKEEVVGKHSMESSVTEEGAYESTTGELLEIGEAFFNESKENISTLFEEDKIANWESYYIRKDKKLVLVEQSIVCVYNEEGERAEAIAIIRDITERRKAEKEIKETKDFLENIFKTTADGIMLIDNNGSITMANETAAKILGYSTDELIEKHVKDFVPEEDPYKEKGLEFFAKLMEEGVVTGCEFAWLRSDGSLIDVEINATLFKDSEGNSTGGVISARDISERIKNRKQIALFREFAEASNQGLGMADLDGHLTYVNPPLCRIFGEEKPEDAIGENIDNYYPQEHLSKLKNEILPAVLEQGNQVVEMPFLSNGKLIPTIQSIFLIRDEKGNPLCFANVVTDITERTLAEEELRKTKEHLDNVIENSLDSIIIADPTGIIVKTNKAFLELLGSEKEEVVGKHIVELTVMKEGTYESTTGELVEINEEYFKSGQGMTEILFEKGKLSSWENYYLRKDKKVVPVEMSIVFLYDQQGERIGSVGINRDITNRKKMETQLKEATVQLVQSEKLSALGELTAGVAHELNQPLNGIKIISQSLLKDIKRGQLEEEELGQDLHDIVNQVNKMADIIDHMRIFTRRSEGIPNETIEVNSIVEGAFKFLGQQMRNHNIEVVENLGSDLPKIVGDPIRLEQVFLNLVSNARNAIEGSGKEKKIIEISTYTVNTNGDSSVVMEIKDNGGGVPEHVRGKIFQPFFTTNAPGKGTGLGLSVSSKIIEEHQGRIELDSTFGEGTTFRVMLPAKE
ncbi:MAG: PAS domain S-box protein, partial [Deltaproteobacteria bacterium]|nr:PAS domain S-box protein [Deltaproteobacteria bacterium]